MMVTTHVVVGILFGAVISAAAPSDTALLVAAGAVGSVFPDLDMLLDHRKTLHYPVYFPVITGILLLFTTWVPTSITLTLLVAVGAAGLHSVMDIFSGGQELRPWERVDDRAVFDHHSNRWLRARRVVYSGSVGDFVLGVVTLCSIVIVGDGFATRVAVVVVALSAPYTVLQRRIAASVPHRFQTLSGYLKHTFATTIRRLCDGGQN